MRKSRVGADWGTTVLLRRNASNSITLEPRLPLTRFSHGKGNFGAATGKDSYATGIHFPPPFLCNSTAPTVSARVEILVMNNFPLTGNLCAEAFQAASFMSDKELFWSLLQLPP